MLIPVSRLVCLFTHQLSTVFAIENKTVPHPSGIDDLCIVIETDGLDQWRERKARQNFNLFTDDELLSIIRNAGIAGMGGAGFPATIKLKRRQQTYQYFNHEWHRMRTLYYS